MTGAECVATESLILLERLPFFISPGVLGVSLLAPLPPGRLAADLLMHGQSRTISHVPPVTWAITSALASSLSKVAS